MCQADTIDFLSEKHSLKKPLHAFGSELVKCSVNSEVSTSSSRDYVTATALSADTRNARPVTLEVRPLLINLPNLSDRQTAHCGPATSA